MPVHALSRNQQILRATLAVHSSLSANLQLGASVSVNGCCLTVVEVKADEVSFDVVSETQRITNLGTLKEGSLVNLERSLRFGDEVGGHILSGHISCTVEVVSMQRQGPEARLEVLIPSEFSKYCMEKGFIALNGASLTLATFERAKGIGTINLIPETLARTNLGAASQGTRLNLEIDTTTQTIVDTVERVITERSLVEAR